LRTGQGPRPTTGRYAARFSSEAGVTERTGGLMADRLPGIRTPVQIIRGDHDAGVLPVNANSLHERLPHSKLHFVDANHFAYEDRPEVYAALILDWWSGGYDRA
jgi:pimeloyl-ACP methyl ester carboxylesterase